MCGGSVLEMKHVHTGAMIKLISVSGIGLVLIDERKKADRFHNGIIIFHKLV